MNSLCRLCATFTEPNGLITDICDLQSKLMIFCAWTQSEMEIQMPQKVCNLCVDEVLRSWNFAERIQAAKKQFDKILSEQSAPNRFDDQMNSEIKVDFDAEPEDADFSEIPGVIETKLIVPDLSDSNDDTDVDFEFDGNDDDDGDFEVFGEPVNYLSTNKRNESFQSILPRRFKKEQKNDPFLSKLSTKDFLMDGSISDNGIEKLTKSFPDMKTMLWNDCQYKCSPCNRILKGAQNLYSHVRSIHMHELASVKISCFYCKFEHRREYIVNQHIATKHFHHLKYL